MSQTTTQQNENFADLTEGEPIPAPPELPQIDSFGEHIDDLIPIPIHDNGEPLVDIFAVCPQLAWLEKSPRFDFPRSGLARESVARMIAHAQSLLPQGLRLQVIGAFRPFEVQQQMYDQVTRETREKHPDWCPDYLRQYVNVFSAPPIWDTPPPHATGGAIDLSIIDENGERLDFVSPFVMGWDSAPTYMEGLSDEARRNRDLLIQVLETSGMTNFPGEWWHWSYGEPGWALRGGHPHALYGAVCETQVPAWTPPASEEKS